MMDEYDEKLPRIPEFYNGRSIFVTGFSGFMGKGLVEKLLWSCPGIHRIYVLLRGKRGRTYQQRFDKIINSDVFSRLRERDYEVLKTKIIPVNGDVTFPELGISPEVRILLRDEVSIVFHCAASVRFDDPLIVSLDINVKGTKSVVELALEMPNLVVFVHMSTAYSNCDRFDIEEKIYPPTVDWKQTLKIRDKIDERTFCILTAKYSNHMPNTYVFAKSLGEQLVNDYSASFPLVVFRPSIIVGALNEPLSGWIANFNGPIGLMFGCGLGIVRITLTENDVMPDFVPIDGSIRGVLVCAYIKAIRKDADTMVCNYCAQDRSFTFTQLIEMDENIMANLPMKYLLWKPSTHTTNSKLVYYIYFILLHMIPAFFIDIALRIAGKKPILWKIQRKIYTAMNALSYFSLNYFRFHNNKLYEMLKYIPKEDLDDFDYENENFDPFKFLYHITKYAQVKYLKMKPEDEANAKILAAVMNWADLIVKTSFWLGVTYVVYKYQVLQNITYGTIEFLCNF